MGAGPSGGCRGCVARKPPPANTRIEKDKKTGSEGPSAPGAAQQTPPATGDEQSSTPRPSRKDKPTSDEKKARARRLVKLYFDQFTKGCGRKCDNPNCKTGPRFPRGLSRAQALQRAISAAAMKHKPKLCEPSKATAQAAAEPSEAKASNDGVVATRTAASPPPFMSERIVGGVRVFVDKSAAAELKSAIGRYESIFAKARALCRQSIDIAGQVPVWMHGAESDTWKFGYNMKMDQDGVNLGQPDRGFAWFGNMAYERRDDPRGPLDVDNAIFIVNPTQFVLRGPGAFEGLFEDGQRHYHDSGLWRAHRSQVNEAAVGIKPSKVQSMKSTRRSQDAKSPRGGSQPRPLPNGPEFMQALDLSGLTVCLDAEALVEFREDEAKYRAIFQHVAEAYKGPLEEFRCTPIWLHGAKSKVWNYGYNMKLKDGVDLGEVGWGIAWYGNMHYEGYGEQGDTIFIINLKKGILGHPTVFVHELAHAFHEKSIRRNQRGFRRMLSSIVQSPRNSGSPKAKPDPNALIESSYQRAKAKLSEIKSTFRIHNPRQFAVTFTNAHEFFAYCTEAYHCSPEARARLKGVGVRLEAPAFPRTREDLFALDEKFNLGIVAAIRATLGEE